MTSASSCACLIAARTRPSRESNAASGNSISERAIKPRRIVLPYQSRGDFEKFARRFAQNLGALFGHDDAIAEHNVADLGMISIRMHNDRHARLKHCIDIFQNMRL